MDGWWKGRGEGRRRGEVIEEPRPERQPSPICLQGKSMNIERWMNRRFVCVGQKGSNSVNQTSTASGQLMERFILGLSYRTV